MIPVTINKRPIKFSKKPLSSVNTGKVDSVNDDRIVYQQKISTSTWWLHVGVIACIVIGVLLAFFHWVRYDRISRDSVPTFDGIFSTTSARKKKNSNKSVDGSTVALMILVIFNRLFEHLKLYRFATIE